MDDLNGLLREQAAYYRAGAGEYDEAYKVNPDLQSLDALIEGLPITGRVLELACGTGQWTRLLAGRGHHVTAVDGSPEMLARARERVTGLDVEFIEADLFSWEPPRAFDTVFFCYWLSHVPAERFADFWGRVSQALLPGGRACFVDSGPADVVSEDFLVKSSATTAVRRLRDGSEHRIVKVFHTPEGLTAQLREIGWSAQVRPAGAAMLSGYASFGF
jgi:SAM-dependent methyltransferase